MDIIDGSWIRARLPEKRGSQKLLAVAIGLPTDQLNKILNGSRQVKAHEIPKILAYFGQIGQPGFSARAAAYTAPVFAEPFNPSAIISELTRAACPDVTRPFYYTAKRSEPMAGILAGDILIIEHGGARSPGDLVLVSMAGEAGEGKNELRRHLPPYLASLDLSDPNPVLADDTQEAAVIGRVSAVLRIPAFTAG